MCGNIAGASGIAVGPPGAANVITLLDDQERVQSGFAELDGHTQAGKACAHNQDIHCRISRRAIYERAVGHEEVMIMVMCPACLDKYYERVIRGVVLLLTGAVPAKVYPTEQMMAVETV